MSELVRKEATESVVAAEQSSREGHLLHELCYYAGSALRDGLREEAAQAIISILQIKLGKDPERLLEILWGAGEEMREIAASIEQTASERCLG